jgi:hypothetical protein
MYISKNQPTTCWVSEGDEKVEKDVSSNLKFYFYDFVESQNIKISVDGIVSEYQLNENKIIDTGVDSLSVKSISIIDNNGKHDLSNSFKDISRNLIYLGS